VEVRVPGLLRLLVPGLFVRWLRSDEKTKSELSKGRRYRVVLFVERDRVIWELDDGLGSFGYSEDAPSDFEFRAALKGIAGETK